MRTGVCANFHGMGLSQHHILMQSVVNGLLGLGADLMV